MPSDTGTEGNETPTSSPTDKGLPKDPDELLGQGYRETTHPNAAENGKREFVNDKTGDRLRFDK